MIELRQHQQEALRAIDSCNEGIIHLPTGSGKTSVIAAAITKNMYAAAEWLKSKDMSDETPVFVVLTPRILLTNQIFNSIKTFLLENSKDCQYLIVHSGKTKEDTNYRNWTLDIPYRQLKSTTSTKEIIIEYNKAKSENVPLVIFGTYDSSERIVRSGIPVYMLLCDEAHYLVSEEFNWIPREEGEVFFTAFKKYYFTATLKETKSNNGIGMNNSNLFGPIIYEKTPLQLIVSGDIIRPRLHLVDISSSRNDDDVDKINKELDYDVSCIIDSFIEHRVHCNIGAKMLVVTKGSEHLNNITTHNRVKNLLSIRPNLTIFDISSVYQPRINGEIVRREEFLHRLQGMSVTDEAIIFHINILSEGIDVPGITGVVVMNSLGLGKFLQTLGRATRLYQQDRENLYSLKISYDQLDRFVKPYAWIIVPIYGVIGEDEKERIREIVYALRETGFKAAEDVVIKQDRGSAIPKPLGGINEKDTRAKALFDLFADVEHIIEERDIADKIAIEDFRFEEYVNNLSDDELINILLCMIDRKLATKVFKELLKRSSDTHNAHTPFGLCEEIIGKLPSLEGKILVMFNLEFLWVLREKLGKKGMKDVWFLTPCELKKKAATNIGVVENQIYTYVYNSKVENMPKFDVVIGNPPFKVGMHLTFLHLAYKISKRWVIWLHPSGWVLDEKNASKQYIKIKELITKNISSLTLFNGNKMFNIGLFIPFVIDVIDKDLNNNNKIYVIDKINDVDVVYDNINDVNKWSDNDTYKDLKIKLLNLSKRDNLLNHKNEKNGEYYVNFPLMRGNINRKNENKIFENDFYSFFPKNTKIENEINRRKYGDVANFFFSFKTEAEAKNFMNFLKTRLAMFALSINKISVHLDRNELITVPWLDFKQEWDNRKLYHYFNLSKKEIEFIEKNIPNYYEI